MADEGRMKELTAAIISSYEGQSGEDQGEVQDEDQDRLYYLPDKDVVVESVLLLRKLLFPGYFNEDETDVVDLEDIVRGLLTDIESKLSRQICRALHLETGKRGSCTEMLGGAVEICRVFLGKIPDIIEILKTDVQAAYDGDPAAISTHEIIVAYPGILAISIYRLAHELHLLSVPFIPRMMTEYAHSLTGIDIHPGADIGSYFFIDHGTGVVIGETTKIGTHVKLYQGVTLGALSTQGGQKLKGKRRHPTLEDDVTVYSNATILGGETVIGRGSVIGGNVFITKSVPMYTKAYLEKGDPKKSSVPNELK